MNMDWIKNNIKLKFVCFATIALFIYSLFIFVIFGFDGGVSFWMSYAFSVLSIAISFLFVYFSVNSARRLVDWLFSLPVVYWCVIYMGLEIIVATVYMIIAAPWKLVFLSQVIIPLIFLALIIPCFVQKHYVEEINAETSVKVGYIRLMHAKLLALIPRTENTELKKKIEEAAELFRHSDPASADSLAEIEERLSEYLDRLDTLVRSSCWDDAYPVVKEICLLINERNQLALAAKITKY